MSQSKNSIQKNRIININYKYNYYYIPRFIKSSVIKHIISSFGTNLGTHNYFKDAENKYNKIYTEFTFNNSTFRIKI